MSKLKESIKTVYFPVFSNYTVKIVVTDDAAKSRSARDKYFGEVYDGVKALGIHSHPSDNSLESWLFFPRDVSHGTVAHECSHCVHRIMQMIGAKFDDEVVAYHLGYLVQRVTEFLPRKTWPKR